MYYNAVVSKNLNKNKLLHCLVKNNDLKLYFKIWKRVRSVENQIQTKTKERLQNIAKIYQKLSKIKVSKVLLLIRI